MAGGLFALLDDVAALARIAAASVDDVGAAAGRASAKAAGVVVDDTAVTPQYVHGSRRRARAADHQEDRDRLAPQQAALHPAGGAAAQRVPAAGAAGAADHRRHLPRLRGRREGLGAGQRPRQRGRGTSSAEQGELDRRARADDGRRRDPDRLHPLRRDHGDRAQRGRRLRARRRLRHAGGDPGGGRDLHHRPRLRRGRADREDGRRRAERSPSAPRRGPAGRPRPGRGDAEAAGGDLRWSAPPRCCGSAATSCWSAPTSSAGTRRTTSSTTGRRPSTTPSAGIGALLGWLVNTLASAVVGLVVGAVVVAVMHVLPFGHGKGDPTRAAALTEARRGILRSRGARPTLGPRCTRAAPAHTRGERSWTSRLPTWTWPTSAARRSPSPSTRCPA